MAHLENLPFQSQPWCKAEQDVPDGETGDQCPQDCDHPSHDGQDEHGYQQCKEYCCHKEPDSEGHGDGPYSRRKTCKYFQ